MSISELIDGQTFDGGGMPPVLRTVESIRPPEIAQGRLTVESTEGALETTEIENVGSPTPAEVVPPPGAIAAVQPVSKLSNEPVSQQSSAVEMAPRPVAPPAVVKPQIAKQEVAKPAVAKPVREPGPSKRVEPPKDIMRTLVVEDGHWPMLKGLSETFKDLDDDDDDLDGPDRRSPYQTIVPNDD